MTKHNPHKRAVIVALFVLVQLTSTAALADEGVGYWHWTYHESSAPPNTTLSIAFSGYADPETAIARSAKVHDLLQGEKFICLGGGSASGKFTLIAINTIVDALQANDFAGYDGIAFDIELSASDLEADFERLFAATKQRGLMVLVTVSHSEPLGTGDPKALMDSFFASDDIDYLSPQLYTTGEESVNDYEAVGIQFADYATAKAKVVPSIVRAEFYEDAEEHFEQLGVELDGYIQWQQYEAAKP